MTDDQTPDLCITVSPEDWDDPDDGTIPWSAVVMRYDAIPGLGRPERWEWELVNPAGKVALAGSNAENPAAGLLAHLNHLQAVEEAMEDELRDLWRELEHQIRRAHPPTAIHPHITEVTPGEPKSWSMEMEDTLRRITDLTNARQGRQVDWGDVPVLILADGWWEVMHDRMGRPAPDYDKKRIKQMRQAGHSGTINS